MGSQGGAAPSSPSPGYSTGLMEPCGALLRKCLFIIYLSLGPLSGAVKYPAGARPSKCIIIIGCLCWWFVAPRHPMGACGGVSFPRCCKSWPRGRPSQTQESFQAQGQERPEQESAFPRPTRTGTMFSPFLEDSSLNIYYASARRVMPSAGT
jgi:hypothetical protein